MFPFQTIVLERFLLTPEESTHRRFTLAHEAGHVIAMRLNPDSAACFHHAHDLEREYTLPELRERYSISEWQANTIAASLLMPVPVMRKTLRKFNGGKRLPVYGETVFHPREKVILQKMAASLGVSFTALVIRLRGLGCSTITACAIISSRNCILEATLHERRIPSASVLLVGVQLEDTSLSSGVRALLV